MSSWDFYYYYGGPYFEACYLDLPESAWTGPSQYDADTILLIVTWCLVFSQSDHTEETCAVTIQANKLSK